MDKIENLCSRLEIVADCLYSKDLRPMGATVLEAIEELKTRISKPQMQAIMPCPNYKREGEYGRLGESDNCHHPDRDKWAQEAKEPLKEDIFKIGDHVRGGALDTSNGKIVPCRYDGAVPAKNHKGEVLYGQ
jgi:hypothetical protein